MDDRTAIRASARRLTEQRAGLLRTYPFFGRLLLHLPFGFAACGTAYTDMQKIVFDPGFLQELDDDMLCFVFLHEVMHCVLNHCTRGKSLQRRLYNVACDIVVNSVIMETMGVTEFSVAGHEAMHLAPDGKEGREYTAEQVYRMLMNASPEELEEMYGSSGVDDHTVWEDLEPGMLEGIWENRVKKAGKGAGNGSGIPAGLKRYLREIGHNPRTNWRQLLHDFIRHDRSDYTFNIPDRRYGYDIIMPSFQYNIDGERVENVWFFADTSGSVTDGAVNAAYAEIRQATEQIGSVAGMLSFFDCEVSDPVPFETAGDLLNITPVGGGGTSFHAVFKYVQKYCETHTPDEHPELIIIITDGYSKVPDESEAMGIPVIWIIVDSDITPEWGRCVHIET